MPEGLRKKYGHQILSHFHSQNIKKNTPSYGVLSSCGFDLEMTINGSPVPHQRQPIVIDPDDIEKLTELFNKQNSRTENSLLKILEKQKKFYDEMLTVCDIEIAHTTHPTSGKQYASMFSTEVEFKVNPDKVTEENVKNPTQIK